MDRGSGAFIPLSLPFNSSCAPQNRRWRMTAAPVAGARVNVLGVLPLRPCGRKAAELAPRGQGAGDADEPGPVMIAPRLVSSLAACAAADPGRPRASSATRQR